MNPLVIAQLGLAGVQGLSGLIMGATNKRPTMTIPDEVTNALELAQKRAGETLIPGQGYYEDKIDQNATGALTAARQAASSPAQLLEAAIGINRNTNDSLSTLAIEGASRQDRNTNQLYRELHNIAKWKQQLFETNEMRPFYEKAATASSLIGSGIQNAFGALNSQATINASNEQAKIVSDMLKQLSEGEGETMSQALTNDAPQTASLPVPELSLDNLPTFLGNLLLKPNLNYKSIFG